MYNSSSKENAIANFDKSFKEFLGSYPSIDKDRPASWIVFNADRSTIETYLLKACHANMRYHAPKTYDTLITAVPCNSDASLSFLRNLISGPFKCVSDLVSLKQDPSGPWYLELSSLNKWPANLLFNFCIASRVPIEYPKETEYGYQLVQEGYEPTLAHLIAMANKGLKHNKNNPRDWLFNRHVWFNSNSDWRRIIAGEPAPTLLQGNFKANPGLVTPCNVIWGESTDARKLYTMPDEKIAEYFDMEPKKKAEEEVWVELPVPDEIQVLAANVVVVDNIPQVPPHWIFNGPPPAPLWGFEDPEWPIADDFPDDDDDDFDDDDDDDFDNFVDEDDDEPLEDF